MLYTLGFVQMLTNIPVQPAPWGCSIDAAALIRKPQTECIPMGEISDGQFEGVRFVRIAFSSALAPGEIIIGGGPVEDRFAGHVDISASDFLRGPMGATGNRGVQEGREEGGQNYWEENFRHGMVYGIQCP